MLKVEVKTQLVCTELIGLVTGVPGALHVEPDRLIVGLHVAQFSESLDEGLYRKAVPCSAKRL